MREELQTQRVRMVDYLKLKLTQEDWHGVADAAMDIREIDAALKVLDKQAVALPRPLAINSPVPPVATWAVVPK